MSQETPAPAKIQRVLVVAKAGEVDAFRLAGEIGARLRRRKLDVSFEAKTAEALGEGAGIGEEALTAETDLIVVAGGDGTLLSVARAAAPLDIPILGVNLGSLGFLTELQPGEVFDGLDAVLAGRYAVDERQALRVRPVRCGHSDAEYAVLNDAVMSKSALSRMITIAVRVDGDPVTTYTSDGLIVSTPTGSTAYNLSAGGPVLDPRMGAFVIAPICPHSMTYRPLVVPSTVVVEVELRSDGEAVYLTLDGQVGFPMDVNDSLTVDSHPHPVKLVRIARRSFFEVLQRKLRWGERPPG